MSKKIFVANWKMHGSRAFVEDYALHLRHQLSRHSETLSAVQIVICPPFPYLSLLQHLLKIAPTEKIFAIGGQNVSTEPRGAFTGEVSAEMLADAGCRYALVGHSERRMYFREDNAMLLQKVARLSEAGITPIFCVGEPLAARESGSTQEALAEQLWGLGGTALPQGCILAYEPVWAIGTGKTPTREQVQEAHHGITQLLAAEGLSDIPILYGGSVTPANAGEFLSCPEVRGVLVGGASLKCADFCDIISAAF